MLPTTARTRPAICVCLALLAAWLTAASRARAQNAQSARLRPPGSTAAAFGQAVAVFDHHLFVGAPGDDERSPDAGAVYLYTRQEGGWQAAGKVMLPADVTSAGLGVSLAANADTLVVGESRHSFPVPLAGRAHVFDLRAGRPPRHGAVLQPPGLPIAAGFGNAVALDADVALIGAHGADGYAKHSGAVYVYRRNGPDWRQTGRITAPDGAYGDAFGVSVALDDRLAVVGAPGHGDGGAAYVFAQAGDGYGVWEVVSKLVPAVHSPGARFGERVAIRGRRAVIGAPYSFPATGGPAAVATGAAYLFEAADTTGTDWRQIGRPTPGRGAGDRFGAAVALSASMVAVGAPGADAMGPDTGVVHLYALHSDRSPPTHVARLAVPVSDRGDAFASALGLSDALLAVGAPGAGGNAGAVRTYDLRGGLRGEDFAFDLVVSRHDLLASVNAIGRDAHGFLLLGTIYGGLSVYDGRSLKTYRSALEDPSSLSNDTVLALLRDRGGNVWVGTEDGLNRLDARGGIFVRYALGDPAAASTQPVVALFEDRSGVLWTGTDGQLFRYRPEQDRFEPFDAFTGPPQELDETYISGIQQDSHGALWVLAKNLWENHASLYRVDVAADRVERFELAPEWGQVGPFLIDSRGDFWLKAPAPAVFPPAGDGIVRPAGAPSDEAHWAWLETRDGVVLAATSAGVYRYDPRRATTRLHSLMPRAPSDSAQGRILSLYEDHQGRLFLGTDEGAFRLVDPTQPATVTDPPLVLTRVEITGRDGTRSLRPLDLESIELSHRDYGLHFEYSVLDFPDTGSTRFRYRLQPFDRDWVQAEDSRTARYTNVPPGDYLFRVETVPAAPEAPLATVAIAVRIAPPYWGTWWFRAVIGLVAIGLVVGAYRYRAARRRDLEGLRMRIAGDLHDDLSTNLSGIALMSERVQRGSGLGEREVTYLRRITETSRSMLEDLRDLVWMIDPGHDEVEHLVDKMAAVAETLLPGRCSFVGGDLSSLGRIGMHERREILRIYKELLHNVVRHANAERVSIDVREHDHRFTLRVADDGVGFDPEAATPGHGLTGLQRRAERLGATLQVDSRPGEGTRVTLVLDLAGHVAP